MLAQPAVTRAQQLGDLILADPVVLGVVEHGQQHVEVFERIREPVGSGEAQIHEIGCAPLRELRIERQGRRLDRPAEWFEERVHQ